ncbi:MAG: hypothetical protein KJN97_00100, partial [Deltaproteobacteria bacterium]|nr:hypothetical protein [Deltaproteobacteria bacterium]
MSSCRHVSSVGPTVTHALALGYPRGVDWQERNEDVTRIKASRTYGTRIRWQPLHERRGIHRSGDVVTEASKGERQRWLVLLPLLALGTVLHPSAQVSAQDPPAESDAEVAAEASEDEEVETRTKVGARLMLKLPEPAEKLSYPVPKRGVGMPANVETDLEKSFPKRGSVLPPIPPPRPYFEFKEGLYNRIGLKVAFSYQMLALGATSAKPAGEGLSQGKQTAWAGSLLIEAQWVLYQREKDYPGSFVAAFDWRHTLQGTAQPSFFSLDTGSAWAHDFYYLSWRPWFPVLFYEQGFKKDVFVLRVGNLTPPQFIDFFRFKDPRTSFSGAPFTAPA